MHFVELTDLDTHLIVGDVVLDVGHSSDHAAKVFEGWATKKITYAAGLGNVVYGWAGDRWGNLKQSDETLWRAAAWEQMNKGTPMRLDDVILIAAHSCPDEARRVYEAWKMRSTDGFYNQSHGTVIRSETAIGRPFYGTLATLWRCAGLVSGATVSRTPSVGNRLFAQPLPLP